jgi:predicted membrane channel-forming protein YqfA (hemolysin III family)
MSQKTFKYLHAFIFLCLGLLLVVKYLDLFPLPNWLLGVGIALGAIVFLLRGFGIERKPAS